MAVKAVIDRIVDGKHVVLLVGTEETEKVVPMLDLPAGAKEGDWVTIDPSGVISNDPAQTGRAKSTIQDKMALLRKGKSKFRK